MFLLFSFRNPVAEPFQQGPVYVFRRNEQDYKRDKYASELTGNLQAYLQANLGPLTQSRKQKRDDHHSQGMRAAKQSDAESVETKSRRKTCHDTVIVSEYLKTPRKAGEHSADKQ